MMEKVAMMTKGMPGNVGRVRGYRPLNMVAEIRMQVASTEAEKENMAPVEIRSDNIVKGSFRRHNHQASVFCFRSEIEILFFLLYAGCCSCCVIKSS